MTPGPSLAGLIAARPRIVLSQVIYLLFCIEVGLVLLLLPWTLLWDNNYFFSLQPQHSEFWLSNHLRGAISGVGLVNLWLGLDEAITVIHRKRERSKLNASSRR